MKLNPTPELTHATPEEIAELEALCDNLFRQGKKPDEVTVELKISPATTAKIYKHWLQASYERGKRALAEDRRALYERLKAADTNPGVR